jgi:hypothetical protein
VKVYRQPVRLPHVPIRDIFAAMKRTASLVFLALSLFLVQQGAMLHVLAHVPRSAGGHDTVAEPATPLGDLCEECVAFHAVGSAVPSAEPASVHVAPFGPLLLGFRQEYLPQPSVPFFAHAPPALR